MTEVAFHVNAVDKVAYTCRLLRKAAAMGSRVVVTGEPDDLAQLDAGLWAFAALEFIPHCRADAPAAIVRRSPVVIGQTVSDASVRVHLGGSVEGDLARFDRVIEVVGKGESERSAARARWKQYSGQGFSLSHHDVSQSGRRHA